MKRMEGKKVAVHECANFEFDNDDPAGCGESWAYCHSPASGRYECGCRHIYAQQFCPFYKAGKLRGIWMISEAEIESAKRFVKEFIR